MAEKFDPFEDRLSRDIRNALSEAFAQALTDLSMESVQRVAEEYFTKYLESWHRDYIHERLSRYEKALVIIKDEKISEVFARALILWDLELFFEVHEILEHAWLSSQGHEKLVLQAMIRAAGVYIHLPRGNRIGARKMASKAVDALIANRAHVPPLFDLELLLAKLQKLDPVPPKLRPL